MDHDEFALLLWQLLDHDHDRDNKSATCLHWILLGYVQGTPPETWNFRAAWRSEQLATALQDTIKRFGDRRSDWVSGLIAMAIANQTEAQKRWAHECKRMSAKLFSQMSASYSEFSGRSFIISNVTKKLIHGLGALLLDDVEGIRKLLNTSALETDALDAIENIGPPARDSLIEDFMSSLDRDSHPYWRYAKPLARMIAGRDDDLRQIIARLDLNETQINNALSTLRYVGEQAAQLDPSLIDRLMRLAEQPYHAGRAILALGTVGRNSSTALDFLLDCARNDNGLLGDDPGDDVNPSASTFVQANAIEALGERARDADRVVPRLIACLTEFEEYDPDYQYDSDYYRIADALAAFGPDAAPAIPELAKRLLTVDKEFDKRVIRALGMIGPAAQVTLPELCELAARNEIDPDDPTDNWSEIAVAIRAIRGN